MLELEKASIALSIPSAIDAGTSTTSQLSNTKPRAGSGVIVGVAVGEGVAVAVAVSVGVGLSVGLAVALGMAVGAGVAVSDGVVLGNSVGLSVAVGDLVAVGVGVSVGWLSALQPQRIAAIIKVRARRMLSFWTMIPSEANTVHQRMPD